MPPLKLKRISWFTANTLAAVVLILLFLDPTRPLLPIFILLGSAAPFAGMPFVHHKASSAGRWPARIDELDPVAEALATLAWGRD
jgi:hypothetical protein